MKTTYCLVSLMALSLALTACNPKNEEADKPVAATETADAQADADEPHMTSEVLVEEKTEKAPEPRCQSKPVATTAKAKPAAAPAKTKATSETIYVETFGTQGKVWGHVTMTGDRGSGTIHDADENTLAVTVTRHGNELFAIDQNSRQYVFKLK